MKGEVFTIKVESTLPGRMKWLRERGALVELRSRKALRNYIHNHLSFVAHKVYCNGAPFEFGQP